MKQRAFLAIGTIVLCAGLLAGCGKVTKGVEINYGETYKIEDEKLEGKENLTWESADAEIVEVADDGTVTAKAPGKAKVAIKENGKSVGEYTFNVSIVPIEQIIFSSDTIEVTDGDTVAVKYTLLPQNASDYGITWTSADETIVKVRDVDEVKLIAQSEGKTTIIATTDNGVTAQCAVEVVPKSAYEQLTKDEKEFVNDILPIMSNFKNPASVRFNAIYKLFDGNYTLDVAAQNGFGGNTVTTYMFDANLNYFLKMDNYKETKGNMNADLVTQAVHEKLGY